MQEISADPSPTGSASTVAGLTNAGPTNAVPTNAGPTNDLVARRREITVAKRRATLVLLATAIAWILIRTLADERGVWGFAEAGFQAAMVGGLADWFAVTALFRHPLGIPIPHTAILPSRKTQLGVTLGNFVQESFLSAEVLRERIQAAGVSLRLGEWLIEPENAATVARYASDAAAEALKLLDDPETSEAIVGAALHRLERIEAAPLAARIVDVVTEGGRHHEIFDAALGGITDVLAEQRPTLRARFEQESPWWVPEAIDDRVFDRIYAGVQTFLNELRHDPNHELRTTLDVRVHQLAERLRTSPEVAARVEDLKRETLDNPAVAAWAAEMWDDIRRQLVDQANQPSSPLRDRLAETVQRVGRALIEDPALRARVDETAMEVTFTLLNRYDADIRRFIASTVERWDTTETTERVELLLGRDLQIIRINGSVVGGLAGMAIHLIGLLVG